MYCITLTADGKQVDKKEMPKRARPRNGFEKRVDGNFYKILDDPRCISDIEIKEAERIRKEEESKPKLGPIRTPLPSPACTDSSKGTILLEKAKKKTDKTFFKRKICFKSMKILNVGDVDAESSVYTDARLPFLIYITDIDKVGTFKKVEVFFQKNIIKFWVNRTTGEADYVAVNALE